MVALSILNYMLRRDILYPPFIFCAVWCTATTAFLLFPMRINNLGAETVGVFIGGAACLSAGAALGKQLFSRRASESFSSDTRNFQPAKLLLLYCLCTVPLFFYETVQLAGQFSFSPVFLIAAKHGIVQAAENGGRAYSNVVVRSAPLISVLTTWLLIAEKQRKILIILAAIASVFLCVLTAGRIWLLMLLCGSFVLTTLRRRDRSLGSVYRKVAIIGLSGLLVMTCFTLLVKPETQERNGLSVAATLSMVYIAGPLAGFDYRVEHAKAFEDEPDTTLAPLLSPFGAAGLVRLRAMPTYEDNVDVPFPMNVFTFYRPYYHDFGFLGCLLVPMFLGICSSYFYEASIAGNRVAWFLLSINTYVFAYSIFTTLNQFALYGYTFAFAFLYYAVMRKAPVIRLWRSAKSQSAQEISS
jgi:oligosaccharide repeat unit polymerase